MIPQEHKSASSRTELWGLRCSHGKNWPFLCVSTGGPLSTVQLFGCLAIVETHTLWYFGHHCFLIVGFDALGKWHFWIFTL